MDTNQSDLTTHIATVLQSLPPLLRDYVVKEKFVPVINQIMTRYGLHVDQGAVLEQEVILLLIGVRNPDEFSMHLEKDGALSSAVVGNIIGDINTSIFVPLQQQMRGESTPEIHNRPTMSPLNHAQVAPDDSMSRMNSTTPVAPNPAPAAPAPQKTVNTNVYQMPQDFVPPPPNAPAFARVTPPSNLPGANPVHAQSATPTTTTKSSEPIQVHTASPTSPTPASAALPPQALRPKVAPPAQKPGQTMEDYKTDPYREPIE